MANGGRRPPGQRRESAASPGRTGSRGRVGRRGWWRSFGELLNPSAGPPRRLLFRGKQVFRCGRSTRFGRAVRALGSGAICRGASGEGRCERLVLCRLRRCRVLLAIASLTCRSGWTASGCVRRCPRAVLVFCANAFCAARPPGALLPRLRAVASPRLSQRRVGADPRLHRREGRPAHVHLRVLRRSGDLHGGFARRDRVARWARLRWPVLPAQAGPGASRACRITARATDRAR